MVNCVSFQNLSYVQHDTDNNSNYNYSCLNIYIDQVKCASLYCYLILTMTSWGRHNPISQVKFRVLKKLSHEHPVSTGQELRHCHPFRALPACSARPFSLKVSIILTFSIMDASTYFKFNINEIIQKYDLVSGVFHSILFNGIHSRM